MAKYSFWEGTTPEEQALNSLRTKFVSDGYHKQKHEFMNTPCPKCGHDQLVNVTWNNGDLKRVLAICLHCGYEGKPVDVKQERMF